MTDLNPHGSTLQNHTICWLIPKISPHATYCSQACLYLHDVRMYNSTYFNSAQRRCGLSLLELLANTMPQRNGVILSCCPLSCVPPLPRHCRPYRKQPWQAHALPSPQKNIKTNSGPEAERPEDTQMRKRIPNPHFLPKRKEQKQLSCATKRIFAAAQQTSAKSLPSPALHCRPSSKTRGTHHLPYQRDTCAAS